MTHSYEASTIVEKTVCFYWFPIPSSRISEVKVHAAIKPTYKEKLEGKIEESEEARQPLGIKPRTLGLCSQCSATEL